jgi:hypothetical protein
MHFGLWRFDRLSALRQAQRAGFRILSLSKEADAFWFVALR